MKSEELIKETKQHLTDAIAMLRILKEREDVNRIEYKYDNLISKIDSVLNGTHLGIDACITLKNNQEVKENE